MRVLFITLMFVVLFSACQPENPQGPSASDVWGPDAAATMEAFMGAVATPIGSAFIGYSFLASAVYGSIISYQVENGLRTHPSNYLLPDEYLLESNPFECTGQAHNKNLHYYSSQSGRINAILNLETNALSSVISNYTSCDPEINQDSALVFFQSQTFADYLNSLDRTKYSNKTLSQILAEKAQVDTSGVVNYVIGFLNDFNSRFSNSSDYDAKINHINSEITDRLNISESANRKNPKLIFLTVMKHSIYYWR